MRSLQAAFVLMVLVCVAGCGSDDSPVAPVDPNELMYGRWDGTLTMAFPGQGYTQDPMQATIGVDYVAVKLSGASYPSTLLSIGPTTITFTVAIAGGNWIVRCVGGRVGEIINGTATIAGMAEGTFALERSEWGAQGFVGKDTIAEVEDALRAR